jgi:hypothetical protein
MPQEARDIARFFARVEQNIGAWGA